MNELLGAAAQAVTAAGLLTLLAAPVHGLNASLRLALEFWLAAELLRLSAQPTWSALGVAAVIVAIRQLVQIGRPLSPPRTGGGARAFR
ncbi:MAG: DUF1622 domain-containing protein [Myxococcaceae bacterium]